MCSSDLYAMYAGKINGPLLELAKKELWMFSGLDEPGQAFAMLSRVDPAELDWATMDKILTYAGSWLRWPLLLVLGALIGISFFFGSVEKLKRKLDMEKLLSENSRNFPCLLPIVGKGKYLLSAESYDKGPWRIARTPIQFALAHGILNGPNGFPCTMEEALDLHVSVQSWRRVQKSGGSVRAAHLSQVAGQSPGRGFSEIPGKQAACAPGLGTGKKSRQT